MGARGWTRKRAGDSREGGIFKSGGAMEDVDGALERA
jgi:hypothetical protein